MVSVYLLQKLKLFTLVIIAKKINNRYPDTHTLNGVLSTSQRQCCKDKIDIKIKSIKNCFLLH